MNINKLTEKAQEAVVTAQNLATEHEPRRGDARAPARRARRAVRRHRSVDPAEAERSIPRRFAADARALLDDPAAGLRRRPAALAAHEADLRRPRKPRPSGCRTSSSAPSTCCWRWPPKPAAPPPRSCCSAAARRRTRCTRR